MMTIPFLTGHSPLRWQTVVDVMLEKDVGSPKLHRLRIIQLMESDKNQALRIIYALPPLYYAEDEALLHDMQYGSRPGKMSISPILNKTLSYDILRQTKQTGATLDIDALGCFDRILPSLVLLLARRLGMPPSATRMLGNTWASLMHRVRTGYGLSQASYSSTPDTPLFGAGQGSCAACLFWLLTSTIIYTAMDPIPFGLRFLSVCSSISHQRKGDSFIDDAAFGTVVSRLYNALLDYQTNHAIDLLDARLGIQTIGQRYERYLWVTGGALNLQKCLWYLIAWRWKHGKATLATITQAPGILELTSGADPSPTVIKRLEPNEAHRTLGVYISPSGSMATSLAHLRSHSVQFAQCLRDSPTLTSGEIYLAYTVYHQPKIGYPLPVLTLTHAQCTHAQAPALLALLPRLHLNRTTARSIIHGTNTYGGLGIHHLYLEQGIGQIKLFLGHLRAQDKTSELIRISLGYLQLEIGLPTLALNLPYPRFNRWIEHTWLTSLWAFLHFASLSITITDTWTPASAREHDIFLTDHFLQLGLKPAELGRLNRCRLFYQALTLTDLVTGDGSTIDPRAKKGALIPDRRSNLNWPVQQRPPARDWNLWAWAFGHLEHNGKLIRPLGRWTATPYHESHHWALDPQTNTAYSCHDGLWKTYLPVTRGHRTRAQCLTLFSLPGIPCDHPEDIDLLCSSPIYDITLPDTLFRLASAETLPPPLHPPTALIQGPSILHAALVQEPLVLQRLIGPLACSDANVFSLATLAAHRSLHGCSDGSVHLGIGSHAWLFADPDGAIILRGAGPDDGSPTLMTSYRSELGGLTALLCVLYHVLHLRQVSHGLCTIYCDNTTSLNNVFKPSLDAGIYPLLEPDYDLLAVARDILTRIPIDLHHEWVKGHYTGPNQELKHDLNDEADTMATTYRQFPHPSFSPTSLPTAHPIISAAVYSGGVMVTSRLRRTVYSNVYDTPLRTTIRRTTGLTDYQMDRIAWDIHRAAYHAVPRGRRPAISKHMHNLWHTNSKEHQHSSDASPLCPLCSDTLETSAHVLACHSEQAATYRSDRLTDFFSSIEYLNTPTPILQAWKHGMEYFIAATHSGVATRPRSPTAGSLRPLECLVTQAYLDQSSIGWHNFLRGRLSKLWLKAYTFARNQGLGTSRAEPWAKAVILQLWEYSLDLWRFRNGCVHGHSAEDTRQRALQDLRDQVKTHYQSFHSDHHYVLSRDRALFTRCPLARRLTKDHDSLSCWLTSVHQAVQAQVSFHQHQSRSAHRFFAAFRQGPPPRQPSPSNPSRPPSRPTSPASPRM